MQKFVIAGVFAAVAGLASAPAFAGSEQNDQVNLCAAALAANGQAPADQYRAKFVKSKGAAVATVTIRLIPTGEGEAKIAECKIAKGVVTEAAIKA
ncbi:MAG: hypothetical protein K2Q06_12000 [Parvularculaceae bacterium]|nr:hypothetical protein [Parvularculaceae bacterium]